MTLMGYGTCDVTFGYTVCTLNVTYYGNVVPFCFFVIGEEDK